MKISWKRIVLCVVFLLLLLGFVIGAAYLKSVKDYQRQIKETTFEEIDLSKIPDGTYEGEYDVNFIDVRVAVTVKDGAMTEIQLLKHENGRGKPAEVIIGQMLEKQSVDVDAISGATNSSIVIRKAVEEALRAAK